MLGVKKSCATCAWFDRAQQDLERGICFAAVPACAERKVIVIEQPAEFGRRCLVWQARHSPTSQEHGR